LAPWAATALGRTDARSAAASLRLPTTGIVAVGEKLITWMRPGLIEEYSVSVDGVRQDFIVAEPPAGAGKLRVELAVSGAVAEAADDGARLTLIGSDRVLAYNRLRVTDANGRQLPAHLEVLDRSTTLAVVVDDADAVYPVRIDPTFSDADWVSLNPGIPGVIGTVFAAVVSVGEGFLPQPCILEPPVSLLQVVPRPFGTGADPLTATSSVAAAWAKSLGTTRGPASLGGNDGSVVTDWTGGRWNSVVRYVDAIAGSGQRIDIVDCFRKSEDIGPIARDAIAVRAGCLWMQLDIENQAAADLARAAGLDVVMNHCIKIEHRSLEE
jgi:hypothetical protein